LCGRGFFNAKAQREKKEGGGKEKRSIPGKKRARLEEPAGHCKEANFFSGV